LVARVGDLQAVSSVVTRALECIDSSRSSSAELAAIVSTDPTLSGRLVGIANSWLYSSSRRFVTVHEAIVRVGYRNVRDLLLAAMVVGMARAPLRLYGLGPGELWRHSLATAVAAKVLVTDAKIGNPERGYMAGLLHDVGRIIFDRALSPGEVSAVQDLVRTRNASFHDAETAVFGFSHGEAGAYQLQLWRVDADTIEAVAAHHRPKPGTLAAIIHTADVLAIIATTKTVAAPGWSYAVAPKILASLGPALAAGKDWQSRLDRFVAEIRIGVAEADRLLSTPAQ